jgi:apolipoprotein N-acyltransferase
MKFPDLRRFLPSWKNLLLAVLAAVLLILAFPDFDHWLLAWAAFVPLLWAVEREKQSAARSFVLGWVFAIVFFFGTCWWLTFAPITYAGFPPALAYLLLFCVTVVAGIFPAVFAAVLSVLLKRFGSSAMLAAPIVWPATEFARYWITGNNWNAVAYSQAFGGWGLGLAGFGGIYLTGSAIVLFASLAVTALLNFRAPAGRAKGVYSLIALACLTALLFFSASRKEPLPEPGPDVSTVIAVQPNVPMAGLNEQRWRQLRLEHTVLSERAMQGPAGTGRPTTVIFPESPMNFMFDEDEEFQAFIHAFAAKNNVNVLFNSAEPDAANKKYFNSAVMVGPDGREIAQYDKIYLMPFGEAVPFPLQSVVPALVGSFSYGHNYNLFPLGDARAGVMICFESHFPDLSREYVRRGADAIIEMTNDGYLGPTPVLRQHLANAVFRAVETDRPVLRVTNVGITAYISERGEVVDPASSYTEDTRVWTVGRSDGGQTVYVRFGDWFAWLTVAVTAALLALSFRRKDSGSAENS